MKEISLTLSCLLLLISCKGKDSYPDVPLIIMDLANGQCRYYKLVDKENIKFDGPVERHNLYKYDENGNVVKNDMCEGVIGYLPRDFKKVQNWARDNQGN